MSSMLIRTSISLSGLPRQVLLYCLTRTRSPSSRVETSWAASRPTTTFTALGQKLTWSRDRGSSGSVHYQTSDASPLYSLPPALLQKDLHRPEVEGHRIRLEEVVADHTGEVEAERVLLRKRPIVEARDVLRLNA